MYGLLFLGLPMLGVWLFARLWERMAAAGVSEPPLISLLALFAAYGAVLLFGVSAVFGVWSGMHSLAAVALLVVGVPWLLVQGVLLLVRDRARSPYHRAAAVLSLVFPLALVALYAFSIALQH